MGDAPRCYRKKIKRYLDLWSDKSFFLAHSFEKIYGENWRWPTPSAYDMKK